MSDNEFPFLDRIPVDKRLTAMNDLQRYQTKRHHTVLDVTREFRAERYDPTHVSQQESIIIISEDTQEDMLDDIGRELRGNTDIKERL
jgi:hypothetical protein